jgi:ankyrin repeat protein
LEAGADVHFRTRTNETIVHLILKLPIATTNRDSYDLWKTILKRVVGQGVDLSVQSSAEGDSVFHLAVRGSCDDSVIEILHSGTNVDLSLPTIRGRNTALHEAMRTSFPYAEQKARTLIRLGANLHTRNSSGETALHLPCSSRHIPASILDCAREPRDQSDTTPFETILRVVKKEFAVFYWRKMQAFIKAGYDVSPFCTLPQYQDLFDGDEGFWNWASRTQER